MCFSPWFTYVNSLRNITIIFFIFPDCWCWWRWRTSSDSSSKMLQVSRLDLVGGGGGFKLSAWCASGSIWAPGVQTVMGIFEVSGANWPGPLGELIYLLKPWLLNLSARLWILILYLWIDSEFCYPQLLRYHLFSGAIIMLLRNINLKKGLCNGTRLIVHPLHDHSIDAEILTGSFEGHLVLIPRIR